MLPTCDMQKQLYVNKCINLFSRWPFFAEFKAFLSTIYRLSLSQGCILPLERSVPQEWRGTVINIGTSPAPPSPRYIQTLMDDCPFPTIERPRVMIDVSGCYLMKPCITCTYVAS